MKSVAAPTSFYSFDLPPYQLLPHCEGRVSGPSSFLARGSAQQKTYRWAIADTGTTIQTVLLNRSTRAFCCGLPGWMYSSLMSHAWLTWDGSRLYQLRRRAARCVTTSGKASLNCSEIPVQRPDLDRRSQMCVNFPCIACRHRGGI